MIKNNWLLSLLLLLASVAISQMSYAVPYTIVPKAGTTLPTKIVRGETVRAFYTVTNITRRVLPGGFVKYLPPLVHQVKSGGTYPDTCLSSFTLNPGQSCTLELIISGRVNASDPDPHNHLFVCSPNVPACAGTNLPLNVTAVNADLSGIVQSGGTATTFPIDGADVIVYGVRLTHAAVVGTAKTNSAGQFFMALSASGPPYTIYYAVARKNNHIVLASILGERIPSRIVINELTTVAAAYSMAQFFNDGQIFGRPLGLRIAAGMNNNLVSPTTGTLSSVIRSSPNADQTNAMRSINSLSNLIAPCVQNHPGACAALFAATRAEGRLPPNTLEALLSIAHNPANNVAAIFLLTNKLKLYQPYLLPRQHPDAWTLAVKFNNSGSSSCPFAGPAKTAFDARGYGWITNNVIQGTPFSTNCIIALKPNGQPADGIGNTPTSPIFGGGLLGTAFGITIDNNNSVWVGNFGWGNCAGCLPVAGSVSQFSSTGIPISGPNGYTTFIYRAQGTINDQNNNIWIASYGNDRVVVFPNGDPNSAFYYQEPANSGPFDIAIDRDGAAWVSNSTSATVSKYVISGNQIVLQFSVAVGASLKGITVDSLGNAWVASTLDSTVYRISANGNLVRAFRGGGISDPWGVTVDGDDNVWVANFGPEGQRANFAISNLCGSRPTQCPRGLRTGDPITPSTGYTLPTGGQQVLLYDGTPLYGVNGPPSFNPLMRLTHAIADQAGNVWCANNWKPNALNDFTTNPGGDGMVIFVGLAAPLISR
ncbi:Vgb family protein [Legionella hackeliae]|uniref:NHL repeat protein n=1 Tax=Legionella hackeliae TaxID=449 RepID=A0A0A8UN85_LEGHA|nr:hypothetical protein [Legionella hackeliae]KTD08909.1 NHL repeat protein [Legionella hackeliae]CEK10340.1 conserved exported protein of unknown function [Legionella hackeliae]STX47071.1 NHL repeat protein [Legionella hackeliae]